MNQRENMLRTIRFERPDYIPMSFHINAACWQHYDQEQLLDLIEDHPLLFPGFVRPALPFKPEFALSLLARLSTAFTLAVNSLIEKGFAM